MKKAIVLFSMMCYLIVTTGVVVVSHYCMNEVASVSIFASKSNTCAKCGMTKETQNCCNDQQFLFKMESDHQKATLKFSYPTSIDKNPAYITKYILADLQNGFYSYKLPERSPPITYTDGVYLYCNVFRI